MPVAMITGASKGLGRALAAALAQRGWDLVLDARTAGVLEGTAKELAGYGRRVVAVPGDVTDAGHRGELVAAAWAPSRSYGSTRCRLTGCGRRWRPIWSRRSVWCRGRCHCCGPRRRARSWW